MSGIIQELIIQPKNTHPRLEYLLLKGALLLIVVQSIVTFGHLAVYRTLVKFFNIQTLGLVSGLKISFIVLSVSFLLASILANNFIGSIINGLYTVSAIWMGTFYWLLIATGLAWLLNYAAKFFGINLPDFYLATVLFGLAVVISGYGVIHSYQTRVVTYRVGLPNLPAAWQGKKIVFLADTHLGNVRGAWFISRTADLVDRQKPEMVLVPGDYYDGPPADYNSLAKDMTSRIHAPLGIYFTSGNHEEFRDSQGYLDALRTAGVKIINNQKVEVNGLQLVGTDYFGNNTNAGLAKTLASMGIDKTKPSIMLKHAPLAVKAAAEAGISLMVSGHTHEGQMWPLGYLTNWIHKGFGYGLNKYGDMTVVTTSGVGTWGPPQRVGTQSEIVVLQLENK
ncbi:MAG: metallophosphoesterase [Patescibacteria group bacterium]|nr:metallophosphoesterase [Patescibacteria group bacterium]